jgi:hypothetical protein
MSLPLSSVLKWEASCPGFRRRFPLESIFFKNQSRSNMTVNAGEQKPVIRIAAPSSRSIGSSSSNLNLTSWSFFLLLSVTMTDSSSSLSSSSL